MPRRLPCKARPRRVPANRSIASGPNPAPAARGLWPPSPPRPSRRADARAPARHPRPFPDPRFWHSFLNLPAASRQLVLQNDTRERKFLAALLLVLPAEAVATDER